MIFHNQPAKKIISVFLVLTLVSSLSAVGFVTGNNNVNLAFAVMFPGNCNDGSAPDANDNCPSPKAESSPSAAPASGPSNETTPGTPTNETTPGT